MSSTFGTYNIAYTGMYANQAALTVVSQNLANVNTTGYSRKQINTGDTVSSSTGTGVTVEEIKRARDQLLDTTYRQESSTAEYWDTKSGTIDNIQEILDEFSSDDGDTGLETQLQNFFDSWEELAKDPTSTSCRQSVLEYADSLIDTVSDMDAELQSLQKDVCSSAEDMVDTINDTADQIAALNLKIVKAEAGGSEASDLRDQRDELLDELSSYTDFSTQELSNGTVTVYLDGVALVNGADANHLNIDGDGSAKSPLTVSWEESGQTATISSGALKACLEDADQTGFTAISDSSSYNFMASSSSSITNLRQALNDLVTTLADKLNALHSTGVGIDSGNTTGLDFFVAADSSQPLSISNIEVNPELEADVSKLAAGTSGDGDNTLANKISALSSDDILVFDGLSQDITSFYQSAISWVATTGSDASDSYDTESSLVTQIDNQRQNISSVSLDEEMSNMLKYQNAYSAAAQLLNTVDSLVGAMIDELGSRAGA